jgi:hypothetical protein
MPFCRKCGRRLPEYSESCPDCGQSTTSPMINIKKGPGSGLNFKAAAASKITKAMIPQKTIITVKTIAPSTNPIKIKPHSEIVKVNLPKTPVNVGTVTKKAIPQPQVKVVPSTKTTSISQAKNVAIIITQTKPAAPPKPVLSAKHIAKPKKVTQSKPIAPFTIAHARPVASFTVVQPKPVALPKPVTQPVPVVVQNPIAQSAPVVTPAKPDPLKSIPILLAKSTLVNVATPTKPTIAIKPTLVEITAPIKPVAPPKPVTPAPVYPEHEIIKSNVSLKEDLIANPHDYETETFQHNLKCPNEHFWRAGKALPVSNGRALCPKCGEQLRKPKPKRNKRERYHRYA